MRRNYIVPEPCYYSVTPAKRSHDGMLEMGDVSALMMTCLDCVTYQVRQSGQHGNILSKNVVGDVLHLLVTCAHTSCTRDSQSLLYDLSDRDRQGVVLSLIHI